MIMLHREVCRYFQGFAFIAEIQYKAHGVNSLNWNELRA